MRLVDRSRSDVRTSPLAVSTRWVLAHRRLVAGVWILVTVAAIAALKPAGDALSKEFTVPGRQGFETNRQIASIHGNGGDVAPIVPVVTLPEGTTIDSPAVAAELEET
jgi:RND superfamily putative drug exporter